MYILFDLTNARAIARHSSFTCLAALGVLQFANVDLQIVPTGEAKGYSMFKNEELRSIAAAAGLHIDPNMPYNTLLRETKERVETAEFLLFPFTTDDVVNQLAQVPSASDVPYAFMPNSEVPTRLRTWSCDPQVNRRREDCSLWVHFASGAVFAAAAAGEAEPPVTHAAPRPRAPATPAAPRAARSPSEPRAASVAGRPKPGTSSATVWDFADTVSADYKDKACADVRREVVRLSVEAGINKSTASVQFGKWAAAL